MEIKRNITTKNFDSGSINRIKYIVVHFTANNGDTAYGNTNYFKSYRGASAHYFVDENGIYQSIEDKNIAWHCGAKKYKHSTCRNSNSLGVELCSRKDSKGNFYFMDKTVDNAVELVKMLMAKYNVPIANVIRHYDVTGKNCPEPFVRDINVWHNFKNRLEEKVVKQNIKINGKVKSVDAINKDGYTYIKIRDLSDILSIMYDKNTKLISVGIK
ncbi:MAG: peptidoglycan recognition family protein [Lachnospirales bacterium]